MAHSTTRAMNAHEYKSPPTSLVVFQDAETKVEGAKTSPSSTVPDSDTEEDEDVPSTGAMVALMDAQNTLERENNSPGQLLQECSSHHESKEDDEDQGSLALQHRL
ncbi:hypothetical protein IF1G_11104 [Cordyceps javanica]|uniref:Uncharacterized protein n=1 Tax=Cordyceps javanica TaxID=43265 RepID=A0A545VIV6_9HYPO|nr:hypothetical protein IF1G_11104 [Cordyceps javanica]TQW01662.1 hypothetical protein IF2G_10803 [Cordyceps javanica]